MYILYLYHKNINPLKKSKSKTKSPKIVSPRLDSSPKRLNLKKIFVKNKDDTFEKSLSIITGEGSNSAVYPLSARGSTAETGRRLSTFVDKKGQPFNPEINVAKPPSRLRHESPIIGDDDYKDVSRVNVITKNMMSRKIPELKIDSSFRREPAVN